MEELGPEMCVFMASSKEKKRVFTSDRPPGIGSSRPLVKPAQSVPPPKAEEEGSVVISASQAKGPLVLQAKYIIAKNSEEAIALGQAAFVTLSDISPCSILLNIGDKHSRRLVFPYPIDGSKAKTRIARKSLCIEVNAPAASS